MPYVYCTLHYRTLHREYRKNIALHHLSDVEVAYIIASKERYLIRRCILHLCFNIMYLHIHKQRIRSSSSCNTLTVISDE